MNPFKIDLQSDKNKLYIQQSWFEQFFLLPPNLNWIKNRTETHRIDVFQFRFMLRSSAYAEWKQIIHFANILTGKKSFTQ